MVEGKDGGGIGQEEWEGEGGVVGNGKRKGKGKGKGEEKGSKVGKGSGQDVNLIRKESYSGKPRYAITKGT